MPEREPAPRQSFAARLLGRGARGAQAVAEVTGIDEAVGVATEEAIVGALQSPAVERALVRVLEGPAVEEAVERVLASPAVERALLDALDSDLVDRVWERLLASDEAQKLVERIAQAPEVRAAVAAQGVGLIEDLGRQVRRIAHRLDGVVEAFARRLAMRPRRERPTSVARGQGRTRRLRVAAAQRRVRSTGSRACYTPATCRAASARGSPASSLAPSPWPQPRRRCASDRRRSLGTRRQGAGSPRGRHRGSGGYRWPSS